MSEKLCCYCNKIIDVGEAFICSDCSGFVCDECCIVYKDKPICIACYFKMCTPKEKEIMSSILSRKGVKMKTEDKPLVFKNLPITELFYIKEGEKTLYKVKVSSNYFPVTEKEFKDLWERAKKLGFLPERIPFGERIKITRIGSVLMT